MDDDPKQKVTHEYLAEVMQKINESFAGYTKAITDLQNRQKHDDYDRNRQQQLEQRVMMLEKLVQENRQHGMNEMHEQNSVEDTVRRLEKEMTRMINHGHSEERDQNQVENDVRRLQNDFNQMQRQMRDAQSKLRRIK